jgi:hypothetical protein
VLLLQSQHILTVQSAACIISHFSSLSDETRAAIVRVGEHVLPNLVTLLQSTDVFTVQYATIAIRQFLNDDLDTIIAADAIPHLVFLLYNIVMVKDAVATLAHLCAHSDASKAAIIASGAVPLLLQLTQSSDVSTSDSARCALAHLFRGATTPAHQASAANHVTNHSFFAPAAPSSTAFTASSAADLSTRP